MTLPLLPRVAAIEIFDHLTHTERQTDAELK
jgi:hypothetical protein